MQLTAFPVTVARKESIVNKMILEHLQVHQPTVQEATIVNWELQHLNHVLKGPIGLPKKPKVPVSVQIVTLEAIANKKVLKLYLELVAMGISVLPKHGRNILRRLSPVSTEYVRLVVGALQEQDQQPV